MESFHHTAILKKFDFLRQFSKKQNMIKKNYQLNRTKKFVDKAQQCFAFFTHQAKIQICCRLMLIPWNVVNLSHLYLGIAAAAAAAAFVARLALVALGIVGSIEEYSICGQACIGLNAGVVA